MEFTMIETGWLSILPPIIAIALALLWAVVNGSNLPLGFLPFLIFVIAALMSFSILQAVFLF